MERQVASVAAPADWQPDAGVASVRFKARLLRGRGVRRQWLVAFTGAVAVSFALVLIPGTRLLAGQAWEWLTVGRIDVVQVDVERLSDEAAALLPRLVGETPAAEAVADVKEAARRSGFVPRLPRAGLPPPRLSVTGPMTFGTVVSTARLAAALDKAGVSDAEISPAWDGARIRLDAGPVVGAEWDGLTLMQGPPAVLSVPAGFDVAGFASAGLRALGLTRDAADFIGRRAAADPALLVGIAADRAISVHPIQLRSGPATLLEGLGENGRLQWVMVLWSVPDRVYILSVRGGIITAERATAIANSVE